MNKPNVEAVVAQLNAARQPGEQCEYREVGGKVMLRVLFREQPWLEEAWCELGLRYTEEGRLAPELVARTHSNTKFSLSKRLQKKYLKTK